MCKGCVVCVWSRKNVSTAGCRCSSFPCFLAGIKTLSRNATPGSAVIVRSTWLESRVCALLFMASTSSKRSAFSLHLLVALKEGCSQFGFDRSRRE